MTRMKLAWAAATSPTAWVVRSAERAAVGEEREREESSLTECLALRRLFWGFRAGLGSCRAAAEERKGGGGKREERRLKRLVEVGWRKMDKEKAEIGIERSCGGGIQFAFFGLGLWLWTGVAEMEF